MINIFKSEANLPQRMVIELNYNINRPDLQYNVGGTRYSIYRVRLEDLSRYTTFLYEFFSPDVSGSSSFMTCLFYDLLGGKYIQAHSSSKVNNGSAAKINGAGIISNYILSDNSLGVYSPDSDAQNVQSIYQDFYSVAETGVAASVVATPVSMFRALTKDAIALIIYSEGVNVIPSRNVKVKITGVR